MTTNKQALALYRGPFRFERGYIFDAEGHMVADESVGILCRVRGWGRISHMENPEALQDAVGEHIAKALTVYWERQVAPAPVVDGPVAIICDGWDIRFIGSAPIAGIVRKHGLKIGTKLYTRPAADALADTEPSVEWFDELICDVSVIDCRYRGDPSYDHDAYWMRERVVAMLEKRRDAARAKEAEKTQAAAVIAREVV